MKNLLFDHGRAFSIARKEFSHIFRDKFTMGMALALPLGVVFVFGVAIDLNMKDIPTCVIDQDHSQSSRQFVEVFSSSDYFKVTHLFQIFEALNSIESENSKASIIIPPKFEKDLLSGNGAEVQILVNAADNQAGTSVVNYLGEIQLKATQRLLGGPAHNAVTLESRYLFNPELNSTWFNVPGLMVIISAMIAVLLTSLTVAREWEFGSMELLLSTPVKPIEIIIGKITPYAFLCMVAVAITYVCARFFFGVPFLGNLIVFTLGCLLFLLTYLAQGVMISVFARKQMLAMQVAMMTGLLPSMLLSGFIFPIENMPAFFQYFTAILPARWFMEISRASFLKGSTFWQMRLPFTILLLLMIFFVIRALRSFKKDLEP